MPSVREVDASTAALLRRLSDVPALVVDNTCQVLAWNPLAAALLEDLSTLRSADRNTLRRIFLNQDHDKYGITTDRRLVVSAVSYLRLATTRYPDNAGLRALIADLLAGSADFAQLWNSQQLRIDHHQRQVFQHPQVGAIELDFDPHRSRPRGGLTGRRRHGRLIACDQDGAAHDFARAGADLPFLSPGQVGLCGDHG